MRDFAPSEIAYLSNGPTSSDVYALESKGGNSRPRLSYKGARQGTNLHSIRSAKAMLMSPKATSFETAGAARVLIAGEQGHLKSAVVTTKHILGKPLLPEISGGFDVSDVSSEARRIRNSVILHNPSLATVFKKAGSPTVFTTKNFAKLAGRAAPVLFVLYESYSFGTAYYAYNTNQIGKRELARRTQSTKIVVFFTAGGAMIGAGVGTLGGGVGAIPGGAAGAKIGALTAIPVVLINDRLTGNKDAEQVEFFEEAVDQALFKRYSH